MYTVFEANFCRIKMPFHELALIVAKEGIPGISIPPSILNNINVAREAHKVIIEYGLQWGIMPIPTNIFEESLDDSTFKKTLEILRRQCAVAAEIGITRAYNHVLNGSNIRELDENFEWHTTRLKEMNFVMKQNGIMYGLEFIGPVPLQNSFLYPFFNSITGVMALADAVDRSIGFLFDTYHWFCAGGRPDDLYYAAQNIERMVGFHINDGLPGKQPYEQEDLVRAMPMENGVIDSVTPYRLFRESKYVGPIICEPMSPSYERYERMPPLAVVKEFAECYSRMERLANKQVR